MLGRTQLQEHYEHLARDPRLAFAFSCCACMEDDKRIQSDDQIRDLLFGATALGNAVRIDGKTLLTVLLSRNNIIKGYAACTIRRTSLNRCGGVDCSLRIASDYDLFCSLCLQGDSVSFS